MKNFKKLKVVMLPTGYSHLSINRSYKDYAIGTEVGKPYLTYSKSSLYNKSVTDSSESPQNIYVISDDKIQDGDWYIHNNKVIQKQEGYQNSNGGKIITTTDTSLYGNYNEKIGSKIYSENYVLPQPSQQFIEQYIKTYNKGEIITEVLVEYECKTIQTYPRSGRDFGGNERYEYVEILKVNQDNTINIKPIKDSWSREEVEKLCKSAWQVGFNVGYNDEMSPSYLTKEDWIKENL